MEGIRLLDMVHVAVLTDFFQLDFTVFNFDTMKESNKRASSTEMPVSMNITGIGRRNLQIGNDLIYGEDWHDVGDVGELLLRMWVQWSCQGRKTHKQRSMQELGRDIKFGHDSDSIKAMPFRQSGCH